MEQKKEYRDIDTLKNWDRNPRKINKTEFNRLKKQIIKLGQYKPLLITPDGTVIGGNMRLRVYKEIGMKQVWVSIIEPKDDNELIEYALSDNDRAGSYDEEQLAELVYNAELELKDYHVDMGASMSLEDVLKNHEMTGDDVKGEIEFTEELYESHNYVVLYFDNEIDWLQLQSMYPLKQVKALDSKPGYSKVGIGRVIKGADFLNAIK